jgi:hypothetical protein
MMLEHLIGRTVLCINDEREIYRLPGKEYVSLDEWVIKAGEKYVIRNAFIAYHLWDDKIWGSYTIYLFHGIIRKSTWNYTNGDKRESGFHSGRFQFV